MGCHLIRPLWGHLPLKGKALHSGIAKGKGGRVRNAERGFESRCRCQCQHWRHTVPWHVKFLLHGNPERRVAARRDGQFMRMLPSWHGRAG